jgi:Metal binding domain of Ada/RIO1 family
MAWPTATQYVEAIQNPRSCFREADLQEGTPALDRLGMPFVSSGQFAYVFKLNHAAAKSSAIRCFRGSSDDRERRYSAIDRHLDSFSLPTLASFEYDSGGMLVGSGRFPILVMEWINGPTLDVYVEAALQNRDVIANLADQWIRLVQNLRNAQIAHGDLQHGNVIVQDGALRLVDFDGMFVPSMASMRSAELGHRHYQHPRRDASFFNEDLDNFSSIVIYLSLLALSKEPELWSKFHDENLILVKTDYDDPSRSAALAAIKKIGPEEKRLADILEKACYSSPTQTPVLSNLVEAKSKLPSWMSIPASVKISTKTREVSGTASGSQFPTATAGTQPHRPPANVATSSTVPQANTPQLGQAQLGNKSPDWRKLSKESVSIAFKFALIGLFFSWAWFPLISGIYNDFGLSNSSETMALWTYVLGCMAFGFFTTFRTAKMAATYVPPVVYVPASPSVNRRVASHFPVSHSASTPSTRGTAVVASRARLIYHRPSCEWVRKISTRNQISFSSVADAQRVGYRRCKVCLP